MNDNITRRVASIIMNLLMIFALVAIQIPTFAQEEWVPLQGHIAPATMSAQVTTHVAAPTMVPLAVALPLQNEAALDTLLTRMYDPKDPLYGHFLSSADFIQQYSPSASDYDSVVKYLQGMGLSVTGTQVNRLVVDVVGSAATVERAFGVALYNYRTPEGISFYAPTSEPMVASSIASKISAVVGLDSSPHWATHDTVLDAETAAAFRPYQVGRGVGGALMPTDIALADGLKGITLPNTTTPVNGSGQTIALFELDGYNAADIAHYEQYYGLRAVPLQNVCIDGSSGAAGSSADEVTLDIELAAAIAPGATKIMVYEAPNTSVGAINEYARIASDNLAKQVSTSWGLPETQMSLSSIDAENSVFKEMAAQGQTMFAASGDSGAYDNGSHLSVDDPGAQPYVTGVGGTQLFLSSTGAYLKESTWNDGTIATGAGGGGISEVWAKPTWQAGLGVSSTNRNVPDVSFDADPYTGYSVYYKSNWYIFGGTSCAAPIWAAFTALVNQKRIAAGKPDIGFLNPTIYSLAEGSRYSVDFHDIADGSTNLYYAAYKGYDDATGWGSFNGANLLTDLGGATAAPVLTISGGPTAAPSLTTAGVSWSTNVAANSTVSFGAIASALTRTVSSSTSSTSHALTMTGLLHGRTYYYVVTSANASGSTTSAVKWFTTE